MKNTSKPAVLYPGRFQPPHMGHMTIFNESLKNNEPIIIAIRDVEPDEKNQLEPTVVKELWEKIYADNDLVKVIIIPDIKAIKYGRGVGYSVEEIKVSTDIANISATQIRKHISEGSDEWKKVVDSKIWDDVISLLKKPEDCGCGTAEIKYIGGAEMCTKCGKTWG